MGSSLPNHDAKGWKGQTEKKPKKENQGQIALDRVRVQKYRKEQSK